MTTISPIGAGITTRTVATVRAMRTCRAGAWSRCWSRSRRTIAGYIDIDLCSGTAAVGVAEAVITHKVVVGGVDQIIALLGDGTVLRLGKVLDAQVAAVLAVIGQHIDPGRSIDRC